MVEKVIIVGSGPAGYTAAIYASRDNLDPLLIRGKEYGGQLMLTSAVENFPAFKSILGPDLMQAMDDQVSQLGTRMLNDDVTRVDLSAYPYSIFVGDTEYKTYTLIIATGARARWLGLKNELRLVGKGVSGCAVCDGPLFRGKDVIVVGGGDSAMEDSLYLTKFAKSVKIVHRRNEFKASKIMQERVLKNEKIKVIWNSEVTDVMGDNNVIGVRLRNIDTGNEKTEGCGGLFVAIGHDPSTELFKGQLDLDKNGYIITHDNVKTSKEGVFAAGDVQDHMYKQAVVAAGWGCMSAISTRKLLEEKGIIK